MDARRHHLPLLHRQFSFSHSRQQQNGLASPEGLIRSTVQVPATEIEKRTEGQLKGARQRATHQRQTFLGQGLAEYFPELRHGRVAVEAAQ